MDTQNVLERIPPTELKLVMGEGTYTLRESVLVAQPPPHPSETPSQPPNPLDTARKPPTAGMRLSLIMVGPKGIALAEQSRQQFLQSTRPETPESSRGGVGDEAGVEWSAETSQNESANAGLRDPFSDGEESTMSDPPVFGQANPALQHHLSLKEVREIAAQKRKKPKNSMIKTNSSFVSRVYPMDSLGKKLSDRDPNGIFAFANISRAFHWLDLSSLQKQKAESLTKVLFAKAHALCHDVNASTSMHPSHIDLIMGFSTGDLLWYEPISQKYARINKNGVINSSPVLDVKWMPSSPNLVLTAHADGTLVVFDKDKDDAFFEPEDTATAAKQPNAQKPFLGILKSVQSQNQKTNPVAFWRLTTHKVNALAFSPDGMTLAAVSSEGRLRLIDFHGEKLLDVFNSFFGELYCVCWSPDGNYILAGGQDDLVSIYSFAERRLIARFKGHKNWVRGVAFDPWRCDERNYRFGSVGDDCQLLLWDFNMGMVHTPRSTTGPTRASIVSHPEKADRESEGSAGLEESETGVVHNAPTTQQVPNILPLVQKRVDDHQLSWIGFQDDCIITSCRRGHIRIWDRPQEKHPTSSSTP